MGGHRGQVVSGSPGPGLRENGHGRRIRHPSLLQAGGSTHQRCDYASAHPAPRTPNARSPITPHGGSRERRDARPVPPQRLGYKGAPGDLRQALARATRRHRVRHIRERRSDPPPPDLLRGLLPLLAHGHGAEMEVLRCYPVARRALTACGRPGGHPGGAPLPTAHEGPQLPPTLTPRGVEHADLDGWDYGAATGRVVTTERS